MRGGGDGRGQGRDHDAVAPCLLGLVHRRVGAFEGAFHALACAQRGDARAEGDHHLLLVGHEEFAREFALQAHQGLVGVVLGGFGQQDDELFAAEARQHVLRAQVLAHDAGQVDERVVAGLVAEAVVELLEVVDVEQGDREPAAAALGACGFGLEHFFEATAVERAGELVVAHQAAGFLELGLQGGDALLDFARLLARGEQFVARAARFFLDAARLGHHLVEQGADLGNVAGLGDALGAAADAVVVGAGALGEARELVDETGEHVAQVALGLGQGVLELTLLEDELLEPAAGVVELARVGLGVDDLAQHLDLAAQPLVVEHELVDVAQEQTQEFEQAGAHLGVVCGGELDFAGERAQLLAELLQPLDRVIALE